MTLAADIADIQRAGLTSPHLFDVYGRLDHGPQQRKQTAELRAYAGAAEIALQAMKAMHCISRSGTHFRMAGALLQELQTARECRKCEGVGIVTVDGLWDGVCPACTGSGLLPASVYWRATACDCRYNEFRDNLAPAYVIALARLARIKRGES